MKSLFGMAVLGLAVVSPGFGQDSVANTVHNLARSGPGTVKSPAVEDVCGFCHVPHTASPAVPLWGHTLSSATYTVYHSDSMASTAVQPNGASKLCLCCHDGTIALGDLKGRNAALGALTKGSKGYLGTDLSGSHPVSMVLTQAVMDADNAAGTPLQSLAGMAGDRDGVRLDTENRVQCTSCHDPHSDKNYPISGIHFWRKPKFSEVCLVCHPS